MLLIAVTVAGIPRTRHVSLGHNGLFCRWSVDTLAWDANINDTIRRALATVSVSAALKFKQRVCTRCWQEPGWHVFISIEGGRHLQCRTQRGSILLRNPTFLPRHAVLVLLLQLRNLKRRSCKNLIGNYIFESFGVGASSRGVWVLISCSINFPNGFLTVSVTQGLSFTLIKGSALPYNVSMQPVFWVQSTAMRSEISKLYFSFLMALFSIVNSIF